MAVVTDAIGESKGYHLLKNYDDLINLGIKCWQYHFEFLNLGYAAYVFFLDFVQKLFPSIPAQRVTQMISGIDVIMYQPDEELKKLAQQAVELGVDAVITFSPEWTVVEAALKKLPNGREWLTALENGARALVQHFHRHRLVPPRPLVERPDERAAVGHRHLHREAASRAFPSTGRPRRCAPSATASPPSTAA